MKKIISVILVTAMMLVALISGGCSNVESDAGISVVTTIFPEYDWVRNIVKGNDDVEITMLLSSGVDLHSYQPSADDIIKVSNADMFIYVGGESDEWAEKALDEAVNKNMIVVNLLDVLGDLAKEEELVEGMQAEEEEESAEEEGIEFDEHVWLSLKNAEIICKYIADKMSELDESNKDLYMNNLNEYIGKLNDLDMNYEETVQNASVKTLVFADRFPFRYMTDDYNLDYYAAFVGCSAESEASFETIVFLADKIDELGITSICQIESADGKIAETVRDNTADKNQKVLTFDSMQSVTSKNVEEGASYLNIMENNLDVLKSALN